MVSDAEIKQKLINITEKHYPKHYQILSTMEKGVFHSDQLLQSKTKLTKDIIKTNIDFLRTIVNFVFNGEIHHLAINQTDKVTFGYALKSGIHTPLSDSFLFDKYKGGPEEKNNLIEIGSNTSPELYKILSAMIIGETYSYQRVHQLIESKIELKDQTVKNYLTFIRHLVNFVFNNEIHHLACTQLKKKMFVYILKKGIHTPMTDTFIINQ